MSFYTKFFKLILGMTIGAIAASLVILHTRKEIRREGDVLTLLPICSSIVEELGGIGGDNYKWVKWTYSCLDGDRVIYFGEPIE